jgi:hypothetical protein
MISSVASTSICVTDHGLSSFEDGILYFLLRFLGDVFKSKKRNHECIFGDLS